MKQIRLIGIMNSVWNLMILFFALYILYLTSFTGKIISFLNFFHLDSLSAFFFFVIAIVSFSCALYSVDYICRDVGESLITARKAIIYYLLFNLFLLSMIFVVCVNNLGMMWVGIEMTTLVSSFLVGFYNTKRSVEAAWKYIIICSVGIIFALLGTILFSYCVSLNHGIQSLNWTDIMLIANKLDKNIIRIAFIFVFIGFATKAGVVPMHTWLPDAHSQAVSPISALLSGVLLKTSLYAILRYGMIMLSAGEGSYVKALFLFFGILSLAVAAMFILVQKDIKRLFAYSSIEHIGIIFIGFGIGGPLGIFGAILHIFNHAVSKTIMFFCAGDIAREYKTRNMNSISGVINALPFTGVMSVVGSFALAGFPPFSIFMSELMILTALFTRNAYIAAFLMLLFLAIAFAGIIMHSSRVIFGPAPKDVVAKKISLLNAMSFLLPIIFILMFGILIPWPFSKIISSAVLILKGM